MIGPVISYSKWAMSYGGAVNCRVDVPAWISIAAQVHNTLHEPSRMAAEYAQTRSYECEPAQREQQKVFHCPYSLTAQNVAVLNVRQEDAS